MAEPLLKPCQQDSGMRTSICSLCYLTMACFSMTLRTSQVQGASALHCYTCLHWAAASRMRAQPATSSIYKSHTWHS